MSDALLEPMFQDSFGIERRAVSTNQYGETAMKIESLVSFGVVDITGSQELDRGEDQEHARKTIEIVTRFNLRPASVGFEPDLVIWHGDRYLVTRVDDYSGYGLGWYQVEATSQDFMDAPQADSVFGQFDFSQPLYSGYLACF